MPRRGSRTDTGPAEDRPLLQEVLQAGFIEELDKSSVPWRGRGIFRFQINDRRQVAERVFSREETEAIAAAARETPQRLGLESKRVHWAYDGNWYVTRADLRPEDVAAWVDERYREQLAEWGAPSIDAPPPPAPTPEGGPPPTYLSVCSMFLNQAPYLAEWLEFHLLAGVERFFLYDHESTDESRDVLAPYVEDGTVVVHEWPVYPGQVEAFEDCAERHRADARWIAFMDLDEFLFSPTGRPLPEVLRAYEPWPGVIVNRLAFGSSGHEVAPLGLVIESYLLRCNFNSRNRVSKTIADPARVDRCRGAHYWTYTDGYAIDERKRPAPLARPLSPSSSILRINHYFTRSREEFERKLATPRADSGKLRTDKTFEAFDRGMNDVSDPAAAVHGPAIKAALAARRRSPARP